MEPDELVAAVRLVAPALAQLATLTDRDRQTLALIARGLSNSEIAPIVNDFNPDG